MARWPSRRRAAEAAACAAACAGEADGEAGRFVEEAAAEMESGGSDTGDACPPVRDLSLSSMVFSKESKDEYACR